MLILEKKKTNNGKQLFWSYGSYNMFNWSLLYQLYPSNNKTRLLFQCQHESDIQETSGKQFHAFLCYMHHRIITHNHIVNLETVDKLYSFHFANHIKLYASFFMLQYPSEYSRETHCTSTSCIPTQTCYLTFPRACPDYWYTGCSGMEYFYVLICVFVCLFYKFLSLFFFLLARWGGGG